jgi:hypothetical protein
VGAGHGAAFDTEEDLKSIADFILSDTAPPGALEEPPAWRRRLSRISVLLGWAMLALLIFFPVYYGLHGNLAIGLILDAVVVVLVLLFLEFL